MVPLAGAAQLSGPSTPTSQAGPSVTGLSSTVMPSTATSDGLVLERGRLEALRCSSGVISTLMMSGQAARLRTQRKLRFLKWDHPFVNNFLTGSVAECVRSIFLRTSPSSLFLWPSCWRKESRNLGPLVIKNLSYRSS